MAPKPKTQPYWVSTDIGFVAFIVVAVALIIAVLGATMLYVFTEPVFDNWSWLFSGLAIAMAVSVPVGFYYWGRDQTEREHTGSHDYLGGRPGKPDGSPFVVATSRHAVDVVTLKNELTGHRQQELQAVQEYQAHGGKHLDASLLAYGALNVRKIGYHSPHSGQQGVTIAFGPITDYRFRVGKTHITPFMEQPVDHTRVDVEILKFLQDKRNGIAFKPNRTYVSYLTVMDPNFRDDICGSALVQAEVLQHVGWSRLAEGFASHVLEILTSNDGERVERFMGDLGKNWQTTLGKVLTDYLKSLGPQLNLNVAMTRNEDREMSILQDYLGALSALTSSDRDQELLRSRNYYNEARATEIARRGARGLSVPTDQGAGYSQAGRVPSEMET